MKKTEKKDVEVWINKSFYSTSKITNVMGNIFCFFLPTVHLKSKESIQEMIGTACEMISELAPFYRRNKFFTRKLLAAKKLSKSKDVSRKALLKFVTDTYLTSEGLSTLRGFNMGNRMGGQGGDRKIKSVLNLDPEKFSVNVKL